MLVLGMHRSGTSALARVLNLVGYAAPKNLIKANKTNTSGHWESNRIARLDDLLLEDLGQSWFSWQPASLLDISTRRKAEFLEDVISTLHSEFSDAEYAVLKEPRICRLAPLYITALNNAGITLRVILPLRNPLEVMHSLQTRNGLSQIEAALLWLRYNLDAEYNTRDQIRCFVTYEQLLDGRVTCVRHIEGALDTNFPVPASDVAPQIENFLSEGLRHHTFKTTDVVHNDVTRGWVSDAYAALLILCENPQSEHARVTLDRVRNALDQATPMLIAAIADKEEAHQAAQNKLIEERDAFERRATEEHARLLEANTRIETIERRNKNESEKSGKQLDAILKKLSEAETRAKSAEKARESLTAELGKLQKERWRLQDQLSWNNDLVHAIHASHSWRVTAPLRYITTKLRGLKNGGTTPPPQAAIPAHKDSPAAIKSEKPKKTADPHAAENMKLIEASGAFDIAYYLSQYSEAQEYKGSPLEHFYHVGWKKGYQPNAAFNAQAYLAANPDAKRQGVCPLVHYIQTGKNQPASRLLNGSGKHHGRIAVFMAISGGYDELKEPLHVSDSADYFVFTDGKVPAHSVWQARAFDFVSSEATRTARFIKTHPHLYFGEYDWAIWIDANLQMDCIPEELVAGLSSSCEIATWRHPLRDCVYEEAEECIRRGKDDNGLIEAQIEAMKARNFPVKSGLYETSVIAFRMTSTNIPSLMNAWWAEIESGSRRDQLALPFALDKVAVNLDYLSDKGICMRTDPRFHYYRHTATA